MTATDYQSEARTAQLSEPLLHELKTAVAMITGFAELLETRSDAETKAEATRGIVQAAARLRATIDSIAGASPDAEPRPASDRAELQRQGSNGRYRLLVLEGDPAEMEELRLIFPPDRFDVLEAPDAAGGLETLADARPSLVILDWKIAGGGAETLAELKLREPHLPVIVLADEGDSEQRRIASLLEADEFITRPFDPVELLDHVELLAADGST